MKYLFLPLAALLLVPACKQADVPAETAQSETLAQLNEAALSDPRRVLDLEGGVNFRDLGGYRTADGQQVKWGTVYRSGSPADLTEGDLEKLGQLGIRTVCDFRSNEERAGEPNPYVAANSTVEYLTRDYGDETSGLMSAVTGDDASPEKSRAAMTGFYKTIAQSHADSYRQMFAALADGKTPLAFNCSAGKDRAGTGAALVLTLLGVPRETVVADYALSDKIVDYKAQMEEDAAENPSYAAMAQIPYELIQPFMASDPAYIEAALEALEKQFGSVDAFIEQELKVTPEMREKIRANLLEAA